MSWNLYWPKSDPERVTLLDLYISMEKRLGAKRAKALARYVDLMTRLDNPPEDKLREYREELGEDFKPTLDLITQYIQEVKSKRRQTYPAQTPA
jgi:hypothetical protein